MKADCLFEKIRTVETHIYRNIVSLKKTEDLFDDLYDEKDDAEEVKKIAQTTEARIKSKIPADMISRGFHYTTAIAYPFEREHYQSTRYSNGSFPCWYGSIQDSTTLYETAFHTLKQEQTFGAVEELIKRERAIYQIFCHGILIDLIGKEKKYPWLITNDYTQTQAIGARVCSEGHPGLLAPSARDPKGENVVVFNQKILEKPKLLYFCDYHIYPNQNRIQIKRGRKIILDATLDNFMNPRDIIKICK